VRTEVGVAFRAAFATIVDRALRSIDRDGA
jgi:hypothetical protein